MSAEPQSNIAEHILIAMCQKAAATPPGVFIEVGVWRGGSAYRLALLAVAQVRRCYLFDTFTGIPYASPGKGDSHRVGDFSDTSLAQVSRDLAPTGAVIIPGVFPESVIGSELDRQMGPIAFAHLDVDQYQSYRAALLWLYHRMVPGGVVWLDDYDCLAGAKRAVDEICWAVKKDPYCGKYYVEFSP